MRDDVGAFMKFRYAFYDEPVQETYFNEYLNMIALGFSSYYFNDDYFEEPCVFVLREWSDATRRFADSSQHFPIADKMAPVDEVLAIEIQDATLKILANLLNGEVVWFEFDSPKCLIYKNSSISGWFEGGTTLSVQILD